MLNLKLSNQWITTGVVVFLLTSCTKPTKETENEREKPVVEEPVSARPAHWGYDGGVGPSNWGTLSPVYALCAEGNGQSPINISDTEIGNEAAFILDYGTTPLKIAFNQHVDNIVDNGHTIQVNVDEGSTITFGEKVYDLKQFHFHTPSEHTIDGENLPLEMHFVHQSKDESLAVLSVMFQEGAANDNFARIIPNLPKTKGESIHLADETIQLHMHIPENVSGYFYNGSLTTPPCSENVQWVVLKENPTMSTQQIQAISDIIGPNNRPTQALNERTIQTGGLLETASE
ncbi:MAG: carbonic anhydrase family protein [Reichenbachiella sp.]|uniref:carbonic anhydrase n=1 Tax=Reichenbachiella sp. TaxID=2184521 RepID=UPI0032974E45